MKTYDVIVIGTGTAGAAACLELARRGARVLGIDAFSPPHKMGSHHGRSRSIRRAYLEGTAYVPMALHAWELWRKLERDTSETLLRPTGNLTLGRPDGSAVSGFLRSARTYNIPHEALDADEIRKRWPQLNPPDDFAGGLEIEAGVLFPELCIKTLLRQAETDGAVLHADDGVLSWSAEKGRVHITTRKGVYEAGRLIVTAGARTGKLLGDASPMLTPKRVVVHWLAPPSEDSWDLGLLPVNFWQMPDGFEMYSLPVTDAGGRVKFAAHNLLADCDPDTVDRAVSQEEQADARRLLGLYLPSLAKADMRSDACLYTLTPDGEFVLGPLPDNRDVIVGAFAGHGFKFAPVLGVLLAEMALDRSPSFDTAIFAPGRFKK